MRTLLSTMLALAAPILTSPLCASTLVYEPFAYALDEGASINNTQSIAQGLSGKYSLKITSTSDGTGTALFSTTGLEFGTDFHPVSGGAIAVTATAGSEKNGLPTRTELAVGLTAAPTGTVYYSYLIKFDNDFPPQNSGSTNASVRLGDLILAPNCSRNFRNSAGVGIGKISTVSGDFNPLGEAVYLVIGKQSESGTSLWILDSPSYDQWHQKGGREDQLANFAQASAAAPAAPTTASTGNQCKIEVFSGNFAGRGLAMYVDEITIGSSLADVTTGSPAKN